ncbi:MAG TPA: glycosyltransferase, partial [Myxococcaceae bacterium]|nr:glycosyltransferase [Myxococcaceae bacterium]
PEAQLIVVGSGEELSSLSNQVEALALQRSVHFVGECTDVAPLLQACDAFVLPSRTEGLPVALLEAMAVGLPVVATRVAGTQQLLQDSVTGALVPSEDPVALAERLLELGNRARAQSWGQRARKHVQAHYSLDVVADRYVAMYEKLLRLGQSNSGAARAA